jgi:YD repeat-containing protein
MVVPVDPAQRTSEALILPPVKPWRSPTLPVVPRVALVIGLLVWLSIGLPLNRAFVGQPSVPAGHAADISYVYDGLGRLLAVVDSSGDAVTYAYDSTGNLLSVSRYASSAMSIINVTPSQGPVGTAVTISGTGFSATPSQNAVTFNGTAASVTSATSTQLQVAVPAAAATGPIAVTGPAGSVTSAKPFTVTAGSDAPAITGFTPSVGQAGTSVTVTGTNFETVPTDNRLTFNLGRAVVGTATATSLGATVPGLGTSGRLTIVTPGGTAQSAQDFFVPPSPYTAASVSTTGRLVIGGSSLTITIPAAGKIGMAVLDGTAGQQVSLGIGPGIVQAWVYLNRPDGTQLATAGNSFNGGDLHIASLPVTGTYTFLFVPAGSYTGSVALALSQDLQAGTIVAGGGSVPVNITRAGQRARLSFSGTAGQRLSLGIAGPTVAATYTVSNPDGTTLTSSFLGQDSSLDLPPLPVTGTYGILIDPDLAKTGRMTLTLSEEVSRTITVDGASVPVTISRAGQRARLTFAGVAGQRLSLLMQDTSAPSGGTTTVSRPDGTTHGTLIFGNGTSTLDLAALTVTGTYTIVIDPNGVGTPSTTLWLSSEVSGTITPGGAAVPVSVVRPGQRVRLAFSGTAGQRVSLNVTAVTVSQAVVSILNPDGSVLGAWPSQSTKTVYAPGPTFLDPTSLGTTATYSVLVDPTTAVTGNMTLTLYDVPPDVTGSVTINGAALHVTLTMPGQQAFVTFQGTTGQAITVRGVNSTVGCVNIFLMNPTGGGYSVISPCTASFTLPSTLAQSGTYTIRVDPSAASFGSVDISVTSP